MDLIEVIRIVGLHMRLEIRFGHMVLSGVEGDFQATTSDVPLNLVIIER